MTNLVLAVAKDSKMPLIFGWYISFAAMTINMRGRTKWFRRVEGTLAR